MTDKELTKLYSLKGSLKGQREAIKSELRMASRLAKTFADSDTGQAYTHEARAIARLLKLHRRCERRLTQIIEETQND